jgi:type IV secretion system protein VirB9
VTRLFISLLVLVSAAAPAMAEQDPAAVKADNRIRAVVFSADNVVVLNGTMGISSMVVFGEDERIVTVAMGDTLSWQAVPDQSKRFLFIKPLERDAVTNMNIVTSRRVYNFQLRAVAPGAKNTVYKLRFVYPDDDQDKRLLSTAREMASRPLIKSVDWSRANWNYSYKGSYSYKPTAIFDDGLKTYFQFSGEVPGIFLVKQDRHETLMNYRRGGDYIIVDKVAAQWTLRFGSVTTSVFNMASIMPDEAQAAEDSRVQATERARDATLAPPVSSPIGNPFAGFSLSNLFPRSTDDDR